MVVSRPVSSSPRVTYGKAGKTSSQRHQRRDQLSKPTFLSRDIESNTDSAPSSDQHNESRKRGHASAFASEPHRQALHGALSRQNNIAHNRSSLSSSWTTSPAAMAPQRRIEKPQGPRRPRLIDALVAQKPATAAHTGSGYERPRYLRGDGPSQDRLPSLPSEESGTRTPDRRSATSKSRKVRFTYSQPRRLAGESQGNVFDSPSRSTESDLDPTPLEPQALLGPKKDAFDMDESDDDGEPGQPAIKSVHELRRAGANNRFADEMDDLLSRIGTPEKAVHTMRRNALCELAQKLQQNEFLRQFRDHASRDAIAREIGNEEDIVSGFALVSVLIIFLNSGSAPHLLRQLASEGVGKLLALMMRCNEDICDYVFQSKTDMPRLSRSSLQAARTVVQTLPIWHGYELRSVSPKTVSLQLLVLLSSRADAALLDRIVSDTSQDLIAVASSAAREGTASDINYLLVVYALETLSSAGIVSGLNDDGRHALRIAKLLSHALQHWPSGQAKLDWAVLKLAINTTNNETEAAAFNDVLLLRQLGSMTSGGFFKVNEATSSGKLESEAYDELLLVLGVIINILEHCPAARTSMDDETVDKLLAPWLDNHGSISEADSVEKSRLSVAVGYLSVALGYICLTRQGRERFKASRASKGLQTLLESINQFSLMYSAVDSKVHALDVLVDELRIQSSIA